MNVIDFNELQNSAQGEALEHIAREFGNILNLSPTWSGRGADEGKDLIFTEIIDGVLSRHKVRWLVQCKDFSKSKKSVSESDLGSILDKCKQHKADGFLLVTTTVPSTGLKKLLDSLDVSNGGPLYTGVWDSHWLSISLLRDEYIDILKLYFPDSYKKIYPGDYSGASYQEQLRELLPASIYEEVMKIADPFMNGISGKDVWPFDSEISNDLDTLIKILIVDNDMHKSILIAEKIEFDALQELFDKIIKKHESLVKELMVESIVYSQNKPYRINCYEFSKDHLDIDPTSEKRLLSYLTRDIVFENLHVETTEHIMQELYLNSTSYGLHDDLDIISSHTVIDEVCVEHIEFEPNEDGTITFSGDMSIGAELTYDKEYGGTLYFPGKFKGTYDQGEFVLEGATVDTSSFYGE